MSSFWIPSPNSDLGSEDRIKWMKNTERDPSVADMDEQSHSICCRAWTLDFGLSGELVYFGAVHAGLFCGFAGRRFQLCRKVLVHTV